MNKKIAAVLVLLMAFFVASSPALAASWNYTAFGDSLAYGSGATNNQGYTDLYKNYLETDNQATVTLYNLGVPGWKSTDLLSALKTNSTFRQAAAGSDVITIDIGGNDLLQAVYLYKSGICGGEKNNKCLKTAFKKMKSNWGKIFKLVRKLRNKKPTIIRTMNLYYSSVTSDQNSDSYSGDGYSSDFAFFNPYLLKANSSLRKIALKKKILTADVHLIFNGASGTEDPQIKGYICNDGLHPNDTGYQLMSGALRGLGYTMSK
jgi:lysophospholipase L1-like esterase